MQEQVARALALCGIDVPIYQAGLGGVAGPELAAAVSQAGGLGHLGCIRRSAVEVRAWIRETRGKTDRPFGVNLVPPGGGPDGFDAQLAVVLEERPRVLSLFWGDFADVIPRAKAVGIVTMVQVGSVAEARKAARDGADMVIAQGVEAGGHVRGTIGLLALLPAVIEAVAPLPVLAAGGIADAATVIAVLQLGAAGAWVGTRFVASHESLAHDIYKRRLIAAHTDDTYHGHFYSYGWRLGTPYRAIRSRERWNPYHLIAGGARRNDPEKYARGFSVYCGQGVEHITDILGAAAIVARLQGRVPAAAPHRS